MTPVLSCDSTPITPAPARFYYSPPVKAIMEKVNELFGSNANRESVAWIIVCIMVRGFKIPPEIVHLSVEFANDTK